MVWNIHPAERTGMMLLAGTIVVQDSTYKITFILRYLTSFLHLLHEIKMFNMARVSLYIIFVSLIYSSSPFR